MVNILVNEGRVQVSSLSGAFKGTKLSILFLEQQTWKGVKVKLLSCV